MTDAHGQLADQAAAPRRDPARAGAARSLAPREKAAVIVRLLLAEGIDLPLAALPEHLQAALTEQMGRMRLVDRATLRAVVEDFLSEIESAGLAFPGGVDGALGLLDGHISASAATRLRRLAGASAKADPWERIVAADPDSLLPLLEAESVEVGAVMLSKLPVQRAADLLGRLPGDRARRIAYAVSLTGDVDPETVRRIGRSLAAQIDAQPPRAFDRGPVERVGAILNQSAAATRDAVLEGLAASDTGFADAVRKAIFTFAHIPDRLAARDVPRVLRAVDPPVLARALAAGSRRHPDTVEFLLGSLSQRMAESLREEMERAPPQREKDAEAAMAAVVAAIRDAAAAGDIALVEEDEDPAS